ncbi:MAG: helix-turn-helix domain-containing protein [Alphaproteobacteria bacterium]|nr:helix-turn-helix domain-containing protein [Alphaproteobacteria bacterium]
MPIRSSISTDLPQRLLTIKDVADILQVSDKTVRRWIDAGDLVAHRIGRQWRVSQGDLDAFIKLRRQG